VPLISVLFSTIYLYNSAEFIELLLSQPVKRKQIWVSLYLGLSTSLVSAFFLSAGLPLLFFADTVPGLYLLGSGVLLTLIFVSLGCLSAISSRDKAKGIGFAMMLWLYFALLFDGLVLYLMFQLGDYPIEKPMVLLSLLSPVDLARIFNLLQLDSAVMLGYTGAIFRTYFGSGPGAAIALVVLILWAWLPFYISLRIFHRKDL
jgi:Cu-processing system permease protein